MIELRAVQPEYRTHTTTAIQIERAVQERQQAVHDSPMLPQTQLKKVERPEVPEPEPQVPVDLKPVLKPVPAEFKTQTITEVQMEKVVQERQQMVESSTIPQTQLKKVEKPVVVSQPEKMTPQEIRPALKPVPAVFKTQTITEVQTEKVVEERQEVVETPFPSQTTLKKVERHVAPQPVKPAASQPEKPVVPQPVKPVAPQQQKPVAPQPEKPVATQPEKPVVPQPEKPVAPQPEKPVAPQQQKPVVPQSEKPVVPQPEKPVVPQPEKPVATQPEKPVEVKKAPKTPPKPKHPIAQPPQFTKPLSPTKVVEGSSATLEVEFEGFPPPQISWYRESFEIKPSNDFQVRNELHIYLMIATKTL